MSHEISSEIRHNSHGCVILRQELVWVLDIVLSKSDSLNKQVYLSSHVCNKTAKEELFSLFLYKRESYKTITHFIFRMKQPFPEFDCFLVWMGRNTYVVGNLAATACIPKISPSHCFCFTMKYSQITYLS